MWRCLIYALPVCLSSAKSLVYLGCEKVLSYWNCLLRQAFFVLSWSLLPLYQEGLFIFMIHLAKAVAWSFLPMLTLMPLGGWYHAIGLSCPVL